MKTPSFVRSLRVRPVLLKPVMRAVSSQHFVHGFWMRTQSPCGKLSGIYWWGTFSEADLVGVFRARVSWIASKLASFLTSEEHSWICLSNFPGTLIWSYGSKIAFSSLIFLQNISSFGLGLVSLAVFLQAANADGKSEGLVLSIKCLAALMAASAWPFDSGLYGDDVSCWIPFRLQYWLNGPGNWGPPSVLQVMGMPNILTILSNTSVTALVFKLRSISTQRYPVYLSAVNM